jgi:glycosyltransferase involved in cell wall biosynthesis
VIGDYTISGFVIAYNEEDNIADCLESMKWVDELWVVDSRSEDETVEIARSYTDNVIVREWGGFVDQTRFAFQQTTGDWVLWLDADERLTPEAAAAIRRALQCPEGPQCDGFAFPRKTFFLDRWITHSGWYPERKLRLMRREAAQIVGREPHPEAVVEGAVEDLEGEILHISFPGGIEEYGRTSAAYAAEATAARHREGRRFSALRLLAEPPLVFLKKYVLQRGFLDGFPGLLIAVGTAHHRFLRSAKLWELEHGREPPQQDGGSADGGS